MKKAHLLKDAIHTCRSQPILGGDFHVPSRLVTTIVKHQHYLLIRTPPRLSIDTVQAQRKNEEESIYQPFCDFIVRFAAVVLWNRGDFRTHYRPSLPFRCSEFEQLFVQFPFGSGDGALASRRSALYSHFATHVESTNPIDAR